MKRISALSILLAGCAPHWTVIHAGALPSSTPLAVDATTFDDLRVKKDTEADYVARLPPEQQQTWQDDKASFASAFASTVIAHHGALDIVGADHGDGRALVRSHVVELDPGEFNGFFNNSTLVRTRVTVTGTTPSEIEIRCVIPADLYRPSASVRIAECGRMTGLYTAQYLGNK